MRSLMVALLLVSSQSFAAATHEEVSAKTNFYVTGSLRCVVEAGEGNVSDRTTTVLGNKFGEGLKQGVIEGTELNHKFAVGEGCDQVALDQIVNKARMSYGYVDVPIKVVKDTSESRLNGFGQCIATYEETLVVYLAPGIVLESQQAVWRRATDCK